MAVVAKSLGVKAFVNVAQMTMSQMSETDTTTSTQQKQHWLAEQMLRWSGLPVVHLKHPALHLLAAGHWVQMDAPDQVAAIMLADA